MIRLRTLSNQSGLTVTELILASALMAILSVIAFKLYNSMQQGFNMAEGKNTVKASTQRALNQTHRTVLGSVRLFDSTGGFLAALQLSSAPSPVAGSTLPAFQTTLSPSSGTFVPASVGNSLYFAAVSSSPAKVTVFDPVFGGNHAIQIDRYTFHYFYLALSPQGGTVGGTSSLGFYQWSSVDYVDFTEIDNISNAVLKQNTLTALYNDGYRFAWQLNGATAATSFLDIQSGGTMALNATHRIPMSQVQLHSTGIGSGILTNVRVSICPNTGGLFTPGIQVPLYNSAINPGGFEVIVAGPSGARQVHMRLALVGQGAFKGVVADAEEVTSTVKDSW